MAATTSESTSTEATTETERRRRSHAEEYTSEAQAVLIDFGTAFTDARRPRSQGSQSDEQFQDLVDEAEAEIQSAIDDFGAIQPPEEAQEGHDQILAALEDFSSKLTDVSDAAASGDEHGAAGGRDRAAGAGARLPESARRRPRRSLTEAGIDLGGTAPRRGRLIPTA